VIVLSATNDFETFEQAHRLAFGNGFIPWEFDEGVRSYFWPGLLAGIFRAAEHVWPGSYLLAGRLALSLFSLVVVWFSWAMLRRFTNPRAALIGAFLTGLYTFRMYFIVFPGEPIPFVQERYLPIIGPAAA